jgi:hypothetical protein
MEEPTFFVGLGKRERGNDPHHSTFSFVGTGEGKTILLR